MHSWHHKSRMTDHNLRAAGVTAVWLFSLPRQFQSLNVNPKLSQGNEPAFAVSHSSSHKISVILSIEILWGKKKIVLAL